MTIHASRLLHRVSLRRVENVPRKFILVFRHTLFVRSPLLSARLFTAPGFFWRDCSSAVDDTDPVTELLLLSVFLSYYTIVCSVRVWMLVCSCAMDDTEFLLVVLRSYTSADFVCSCTMLNLLLSF